MRDKKMKKLISVCLSVLIFAGSFSLALPLFDTRASAAIDFVCGENATWYLDAQTGVMTVSGSGMTYDYGSEKTAPYASYASRVKSVIFEEGITGIGDGFFNPIWSNLTSVSFPSTVEYIGSNSIGRFVAEINIPEENTLKFFGSNFSIKDTAWFKSQPEGVVYLGNCAVGYNGTLTEDDTVTLRDGTLAVATNAFYNQSALSDVIFPDTVEFIGSRAFYNTPFHSNLAPGPHYFGKAFYAYMGNVYLEDEDYTIREGTVSVSPEAFYNKGFYIESVHIPGSVEFIGNMAFYNSGKLRSVTFAENSHLRYIDDSAFFALSNLNGINLPEGLEYIFDGVFGPYRPELLKIPSSVRRIGRLYSSGGTGAEYGRFEVSPDNEYYCSDEYGILYNKDKTVLVRASSGNGGLDYTVPETVKKIAPGAFRGIRDSFSSIHLPDSLKSVGKEAFAYMVYDRGELNIDFGSSEPWIAADIFTGDKYLTSVTVESMDSVFPAGAFSSVNDGFTVYLKKGSAMQTYCEEGGINFEFIDYELNIGDINASLSTAQGIDRALYTPESLAALDEAVSAVNLDLKNLTQEQVDEWNAAVAGALSALEYLPADYAAVSEALARAGAVNRSLYTADSLLALDSLALSVDYSADITHQAEIEALAADINSAVDSLVYREADYSAVNAAVSKALAIERDHYTEQTLDNLDSALRSIEYGLDITFQSKVNAFADSVGIALGALAAKAADYSDVNEAVERAKSVNRSLYTKESLDALDSAVSAVDFSLTYDNSETVAGYAEAVNAALESLVYLPADYTAVDSAVGRAGKIDRVLWSAASLAALDQSISSVDRGLNITQQPTVDAYAKTINDKIDALSYAAVTLRNDTHGVIVGATAKEIYPTASLTVDKLDSSNITGANFAVGGKVKTALYYDISIIRNSKKIQPDGTVSVKIRIPSGVSPEKCKVYHVTDDPVDPLVKFTSSVDGSYIAFETDHFSEFAVLEIETVPDGIIISRLPDKTVYNKGEAFDRAGMIITAFYSDGTKAEVKDFDVSADTNTAGTRPMTVYYTFNGVTKSVSSVITVNGEAAPDTPDTPDNPSAPEIEIKGYTKEMKVDYKAKLTFNAAVKNAEGYKIVWTVNGSSKEGSSYTIEQATEKEYKISVSLVKDGKAVKTSAQETVTVNTGFFARIIAFFRQLFRALPVYTDNKKTK